MHSILRTVCSPWLRPSGHTAPSQHTSSSPSLPQPHAQGVTPTFWTGSCRQLERDLEDAQSDLSFMQQQRNGQQQRTAWDGLIGRLTRLAQEAPGAAARSELEGLGQQVTCSLRSAVHALNGTPRLWWHML